MEEPPPRVPLLCIEIIHDDRFSEVQKRCNDYIAEGIAQVWLLLPGFKRAYTVTKTDGLREFKGEIENRIFREIRWAEPAELPSYDFLEADLLLVKDLAAGRIT